MIWCGPSRGLCSLPRGLFMHFCIEESTNNIQKWYVKWPLPGQGCMLWGCGLHSQLFALFSLSGPLRLVFLSAQWHCFNRKVVNKLLSSLHQTTKWRHNFWDSWDVGLTLLQVKRAQKPVLCFLSKSSVEEEVDSNTDAFPFSWILRENYKTVSKPKGTARALKPFRLRMPVFHKHQR